MPNTITLHDWLRFINAEYLSTFVRDGGASIKFVICQPVSFCGIDWHFVLQVRRHHIDSMDGLNEVDFHQVRDGKSLDQAVEGG